MRPLHARHDFQPEKDTAPVSAPVFQQVREVILQLVDQRRASGTPRLPAERELAALCRCYRLTLRDALIRLENEGIIYRMNRSGWYITPARICYNPAKVISFHDYVARQGRTVRTDVLSLTEVPAGEQIARLFGLPDVITPVWQLERRRLIDGHPVMLERNILSQAWCPTLDRETARGSITAYIASQYRHQLQHSDVEIASCTFDVTSAERIRARPGIAALSLQRFSLSGEGNIVEWDTELWRADAVKITLRI